MAAIDPYLNQIRTASYGSEVRESIASGIEQCYSDAVDVVKVSDTAPTGENVKLWVRPEGDEYKVPTWEEFEALVARVEALENREGYPTDPADPDNGAAEEPPYNPSDDGEVEVPGT